MREEGDGDTNDRVALLGGESGVSGDEQRLVPEGEADHQQGGDEGRYSRVGWGMGDLQREEAGRGKETVSNLQTQT